nr:RES family NAD+ phosphorylase [Delftia acidovorans]
MLAQFSDEPLIDLGDCASNIMGDSYLRTRHWSQLLHAHKHPADDGIRYRSRFHSGQFCIALFDRAIRPRGLTVANPRSIDPASSLEAQSIMRRFKVVPI